MIYQCESILRNINLVLLLAFIFVFKISESQSQRRFLDVSHSIEEGVVTYKGVPPPVISAHLTREESVNRYAAGTQFLISKIEMVANTGTYLDSPFHRYADGKDLTQLNLESLAYLDAVIIHADGDKIKEIDESYFKSTDVKDKAVLINTGWSRNWGKPSYFENHPHLSEGAAQYLVSQHVKIVAIDTYNIDDVSGMSRPVHSVLLKNNIPIVEHLCNLDQIPRGVTFQFNAVPVKVKNFSTFPVRAFVSW